MSEVRHINGNQVKELITKFFYRDNHLCFQIILHLDNGEMVAHQEFSDYAEYRAAFNALQKARTEKLPITFPVAKAATFSNSDAKVA